MELLTAILNLSGDTSKRAMQRTHLYSAVTRLLVHLADILRVGDTVTVDGRVYALRKLSTTTDTDAYAITVDNGRGPAILGDRIFTRPFIPHASYDEHVFFAEHAPAIIDAFGQIIRKDVARMEAAEQQAISEVQTVARII